MRIDDERQRKIETTFPRGRYPHDCLNCGNRCTSVQDVYFRGGMVHSCSKKCLMEYLNRETVTGKSE